MIFDKIWTLYEIHNSIDRLSVICIIAINNTLRCESLLAFAHTNYQRLFIK